ncbi:MAG: hypothetical protein JWM85_277 [Acidimicrobiaceae bacterium]|nr:hypothetical protein [Acidimicrobiaceae bacterium]
MSANYNGTIPGSPEEIEEDARRLRDAAARLRDGSGQVAQTHRTLVGDGWAGTAAEHFGAHAEHLVAEQRRAAGALSEAADALTVFARTLLECQEDERKAALSAAVGESAGSSALAAAATTRYHEARMQLLSVLQESEQELAAVRASVPVTSPVPHRTVSLTPLSPASELGTAAIVGLAAVGVAEGLISRNGPRERIGRVAKNLLPALSSSHDGWELGASIRLSRGRLRSRMPVGATVSGRSPRAVVSCLARAPIGTTNGVWGPRSRG